MGRPFSILVPWPSDLSTLVRIREALQAALGWLT